MLSRLSLALLVAGLAAAACGQSSSTLNSAKVAKAIHQSILGERHVLATVKCPTGVPLKKGYHFVCRAVLDVGSYPVTVTELNTKGGVSYSNNAPLRVLNSSTVERAISVAIRHQRHLKSTVACPKTILQAKGLTFTCAATTKKGTGPFTVTESDDAGHVRFVGH